MDTTYFTREKSNYVKPDVHIFVNQAGYFPEQKKVAVLNFPADSFNVISPEGEVLFSADTAHYGPDENSGDDVYIADFSGFTQSGSYRIIAGGYSSQQFKIGKDCYDKVFYDMSKAFYYLRCGTELKPEHAGKFTHKACHTDKAVLWENRLSELEVSGGWHDAGDYGRYSTAAACAVAHLLYAFRLFPEAFVKTSLNIPESGGLMPDILSECRWELDWLMKMQRSDGGVYHKATTKRHAPFIMPEDDREQMYVFPVSSVATADFCAVTALASGIYKAYNKDYAAKLLIAAKSAYNWLESNPKFIGFENPRECNTGSYGEYGDADNRFWAAAEMYCATGEKSYNAAVKRALERDFSHTDLGYGSIGGLGALAYILNNGDSKNNILDRTFREDFVREAEKLKKSADRCGYGAAMENVDYCWGSNMNLLKHAMIFIIADVVSGKSDYKDYAFAQFDYLLGRNATGYSYVSGNGELSCNNPHLRPAFADGIDECMPGMVSGGANRYPGDYDAKLLIPTGTPPMKSYADDVGCYSLNEITIYWNSPAVFTCAYLKSIGK